MEGLILLPGKTPRSFCRRLKMPKLEAAPTPAARPTTSLMPSPTNGAQAFATQNSRRQTALPPPAVSALMRARGWWPTNLPPPARPTSQLSPHARPFHSTKHAQKTGVSAAAGQATPATPQPGMQSHVGTQRYVSTSSAVFPGNSREPTKFQFESYAWMIPHPAKASTGGEDAVFTDPTAVGVADGVGGWAESGIDPGIFARKLMEESANAISQTRENLDLKRDPLEILATAYSHAKDIAGGSTACVVLLNEDGENSMVGENLLLHAANLGDSGLMILRDGKIIFQSEEQTHSFNCPVQLPYDPPAAADFIEFPVRVGDVVIVATDGLFDNVFVQEIPQIYAAAIGSGSNPAEIIASVAHRYARDQSRVSPFGQRAFEQFGSAIGSVAGKMDDISVVVAKVQPKGKL